MTIEERLLSKIQIDNKDCWVWTGSVFKQKYSTYSQIRIKNKCRKAHQVSYEVFIGPIPQGRELDHLCKNKLCINPAHLEPVTHFENMERGYWTTKDECIHGHSYGGGNTYLNTRGHRECRTCRKERSQKFYERQLEIIKQN